ncbi:MAG: hypothetical protein NTW71_13410 [Deltaproteobacteria bacterium]|nr:hypothetical protein [Deltaproteobacteria bacterium]
MKKNRLLRMAQLALLLGAMLLFVGCGSGSDSVAKGQYDDALAFNQTGYTTVNVTVDGAAMPVRQYKIVYVAKPVKMSLSQPVFARDGNVPYTGETTITDPYQYQTMYVSVPEASVNDQKKAIYLLVNNSGWKPSVCATKIIAGQAFVSTTDTDNVGAALKAGYIVVEPGTRSRELRGADGLWEGKAPAPIVDAKAVIRYLRLNDIVMPGSAERIVITGTSGGGAMSVAIAASGNSPDYYPFLAEIGAAGIIGNASTIRDDVFATVAYCPINNLANSDIAYEWQFNAVRNDTNTGAINGVAYSAGPQPAASLAIHDSFAAYVAGLGLKLDDGTALTTANLPAEIAKQLQAEVERQIVKDNTVVPAIGENFVITNRGVTKNIPNDWLTTTGTGTSRTVTNIDFANFAKFQATNTALKTVVAFDAAGVTGSLVYGGESTLYGAKNTIYSNFSEWSWNNNQKMGDGSGFDDTRFSWSAYIADPIGKELKDQIKMTGPIPYLNTTTADAAPYWYVRHGMVDRDTATAMQLVLYYAVKNDPTVKDLNFKVPWLVPHSGNYDVKEAFTWIKAKLDANP